MLTLETQLVGEAPREIAPIIRWQGDQSAIDVAACSFNNDRAIVSRSTVSWTNEVWVIRISDGQTLSHHAYRDGQLAPIVASSDGAYIAENTFDTVRLGVAAYPGVTVIRRVSDWTQVASEGGSAVRGFSGDDSLILLTPKLLPEVRGISVVEVGTGRIMWRYDGSDQGLSAYFTEPSGAAFAVMLKRPFDQSLHPQVSVVMVLVGRILVIPGQYFRP